MVSGGGLTVYIAACQLTERISRIRIEDDGGTYSGSSSVTQSVFSFSSFAIMMTLSPGLPPKAGIFSTLP